MPRNLSSSKKWAKKLGLDIFTFWPKLTFKIQKKLNNGSMVNNILFRRTTSLEQCESEFNILSLDSILYTALIKKKNLTLLVL